MSAITAWIRALAGAAVFCAIALALCPEGRPKRVLRAAEPPPACPLPPCLRIRIMVS